MYKTSFLWKLSADHAWEFFLHLACSHLCVWKMLRKLFAGFRNVNQSACFTAAFEFWIQHTTAGTKFGDPHNKYFCCRNKNCVISKCRLEEWVCVRAFFQCQCERNHEMMMSWNGQKEVAVDGWVEDVCEEGKISIWFMTTAFSTTQRNEEERKRQQDWTKSCWILFFLAGQKKSNYFA